MSNVPENLKYTESHEWVQVEDDIATIGITEHAAELLGDMVFIELPDADEDISASDGLAVVESVKAASDVYSPVSGHIVEVNKELEDSPELINDSAFSAGWICKIKMTDASELDDMMDATVYQNSLEDAE